MKTAKEWFGELRLDEVNLIFKKHESEIEDMTSIEAINWLFTFYNESIN